MHIGNYLGAVRQWVNAQNAEAFYCIVDLHALTLQIEPEKLREQSVDYLATLLAAGLDPEVCTLFVQSQVPYHAHVEASWHLVSGNAPAAQRALESRDGGLASTDRGVADSKEKSGEFGQTGHEVTLTPCIY